MGDVTIDRGTAVVGVDGAGWAALDWAAAETAARGGSVVACLVRPDLSAEVVGAAEDVLHEAVTRAAKRVPAECVHPLLLHGDRATRLTELAHDAGLLVIGSRGRIDWSRQLTGSTVVPVAAHARCPLVVRPDRDGPPGPYPGHVVVGVDPSDAGDAALRFGYAYAAAHDRPLAAVRVTAGGTGDYWYDETMLDTHFAAEPDALALLAEQTEPYRRAYPAVSVKLAVAQADGPAEGLLRAGSGARLLAIGHRDREPAHAPLGPVAYAVLTDARCPVAVLRP
ncbi:MAG TPA: universal stress protein [Actinocatenispora sp.]